jgi:hypothetical protein
MEREEFAARRRRLLAEKSVDELIEMLSAEALATRFLAEICLRDLTGT